MESKYLWTVRLYGPYGRTAYSSTAFLRRGPLKTQTRSAAHKPLQLAQLCMFARQLRLGFSMSSSFWVGSFWVQVCKADSHGSNVSGTYGRKQRNRILLCLPKPTSVIKPIAWTQPSGSSVVTVVHKLKNWWGKCQCLATDHVRGGGGQENLSKHSQDLKTKHKIILGAYPGTNWR